MSFNYHYYVSYVVDTQKHVKAFEMHHEREAWIKEFLFANQHTLDNWIDLVFDGQLEYNIEDTEYVQESK